MLSYRIDGLRNPTIVVARSTTLKVLFINNDDDMLHNVRFGTWRPAYPSEADTLNASSVGAAPLPHVSGGVFHTAEMVVQAPSTPGKYAYFCTVRGHAKGGMRGVIEVR